MMMGVCSKSMFPPSYQTNANHPKFQSWILRIYVFLKLCCCIWFLPSALADFYYSLIFPPLSMLIFIDLKVSIAEILKSLCGWEIKWVLMFGIQMPKGLVPPIRSWPGTLNSYEPSWNWEGLVWDLHAMSMPPGAWEGLVTNLWTLCRPSQNPENVGWGLCTFSQLFKA